MVWVRFEGKSEHGEHYCWKEIKLEALYPSQKTREEAALAMARTMTTDQIDWTAKGPEDVVEMVGVCIAYKIVNGTFYDSRTSDAVIHALEDARARNRHVKIHFGDTDTGKDWHEENDCRGKIGRSTGRVKVPLLVAKGEDGGPHMLDHCIVRIREIGKTGKVLYQHPTYTPKKFEIVPNDHKEWKKTLPYSVLADGENVANCKTESEAKKYIDDVTGAF